MLILIFSMNEKTYWFTSNPKYMYYNFNKLFFLYGSLIENIGTEFNLEMRFKRNNYRCAQLNLLFPNWFF